jgi:hypothetical protein
MKRKARALWPDLLAPGLLLATPFLIFLRDDAYPLLATESLVCLASLALLGSALGALARGLGDIGRVLLIAALGTLLFDVQRSGGVSDGAQLGICFAALLVVGTMLRRSLVRLVCVMGAAALAATLLLPVNTTDDFTPAEVPPERREALPLVVHIILDEQIGVEGLPIDVDPQREHANALQRFYLERGFHLFGRAYAISTSSKLSISNLMNLNLGAPKRSFASRRRDREEITRNAYFASMAKRGYRIHVRQSDYLDYCRGDGAPSIVRCETYPLETIRSIADAPLSAGEKVKVMASMYARLSSVLSDLRDAYRRWQPGTGLPAWDTLGRVSAASAMSAIEELKSDLSVAAAGELHFAHLMLPHFPYAFDETCEIRPSTADWLSNSAAGHFPFANSAESRALRYDRYLEQVACTHRKLDEIFQAMQRAGNFEDALIIVHGDHGSRISLAPLDTRAADLITDQDFLDAYPTLFAIRRPGASNGAAAGLYDLRVRSIAALLRDALGEQELPEAGDGPGVPTVYLTNVSDAPPEPRPLPAFEGGRVYSKR